MNPIRILIVEDFPVVRDALAEGLASSPGIDVVGTHPDGMDIENVIEELDVDLVLLDLHLPEQDGITVLRSIAATHPDVPVIVFSASERAELVLSAMESGARGYVSKRQPLEDIVRTLRAVTDGQTMISPLIANDVIELQMSRAMSADGRGLAALSPPEVEVLRRVANGETDAQIAEALFVSTRTVQNHLARIRHKAGARRRADLTRWAVENACI